MHADPITHADQHEQVTAARVTSLIVGICGIISGNTIYGSWSTNQPCGFGRQCASECCVYCPSL